MNARLTHFVIGITLAVLPVACAASVVTGRVPTQSIPLAQLEQQIWTSPTHGSQFASVARTSAQPMCEATRPPEALATPEPLLGRPDPDTSVTVSFIIGTDGLVHSPLVLSSAGPSEDRVVLEAVRGWRYRPALCNGVPTESEAKVQFSGR